MTKRPCSPAESLREPKRLKSQTKHSRHASEPVLACSSVSFRRQNSAPPTASSVPRPKPNAYSVLMASRGQPTTKGKPVFRSQKVLFTPARPKPVKNRMRAREKPVVPLQPPPLIQDDPEVSVVSEHLNVVQRPSETINTAQQPLETAKTVQRPLETAKTVQRPLETAGTVQQPLETAETVQQPLETAGTVQQPLETAGTVQQPLETTGTVQQPLETARTMQQPLETARTVQQPSETAKTVSLLETTLPQLPSVQPPTLLPSEEEQRPVKRLPKPATRLPSPAKRVTRSASLKHRAEDTPNSTLPQKRLLSDYQSEPPKVKALPRTALPRISSSQLRTSSSKVVRASSDFIQSKERSTFNAGSSSLSTLTNALEKLKMPPPPRPNTSMGFNRDNDDDTSSEVVLQSQDDSTLTKSQLDRKSRPSSVKQPSTFQELDAAKRKSIFGLPRRGLLSGSGTLMGTGFSRGRPLQKVSRQPTLPSVMASPMKGGASPESEAESETVKEKNPNPSVQFVTTDLELAELIKSSTSRTKKETVDAWRKNASRRASLASHALNQSLTALPPPVPADSELGEPVVTPPRRQGLRSSSSSHPSSMEVSSSKSASSKIPEQPKPSSLTVLSDCKIFVDIKTTTGEDAADLFVDMLRGLGARLMKNVGQTCTHIIFRNGLMSTLNRYRLLNDPKPHVVGMAWVVACAEAQARVDEAEYLIDLTEVNVAGINKARRKSMIPKFVHRDWEEGMNAAPTTVVDEQDSFSVVETSSSMTDVSLSLPPLERARIRHTIPRP